MPAPVERPDAVFVRGLEFEASHGYTAAERRGTRRFRLNLELEGCEPYEEDTWEGRHVRVGDATIEVTGQVPRCVFTTKHPETGEKDWDTLTQIARYRPRIAGGGGLPFGMYARVVTPGTVRIGDEVTLSEGE